jgi:hypothetical protein
MSERRCSLRLEKSVGEIMNKHDDEELVPSSELMESMRAVGYSLETAIADLIDNSLAANAKNIWVDFEAEPHLHVTILDDGNGMDRSTLREAMKLAGRSATMQRASDDLGRFGLGLKTASLSQCRKLTVLAKDKTGNIEMATWDLDYLKAKKKWTLRWPEVDEVSSIPALEKFNSRKSGTLVIWENLDLLLSQTNVELDEFTHIKESVAEHLSLVFHRFMQAVGKAKVRLYVNKYEVKPKDPFLEGHAGTSVRDEIRISVAGQTVTAKPFILPSQNKLTTEQRSSALMGETMRDTQGFYIYRNKRLLTYGTWFRLTPKTELAKLARVRVDTPNTLDTEWRLGIMKSSVQPPKALRDRLSALVPKIVGESKKVTRGVNLLSLGAIDSAWVIKELGDNAFSLNVNPKYPTLKALAESLEPSQLRLLDAFVNSIETLFPIHEVYDRLTGDSGLKNDVSDEFIHKLFNALLSVHDGNASGAFEQLMNTPPVSNTPGLQAHVLANKGNYVQKIEGDQP